MGGGKLSTCYTPSSGFLNHLPRAWVPFAELARLDKPTGIYLFYLPHLFGTLFAVCLSPFQYAEVSTSSELWLFLTKQNMLLFTGTVFFRAAACSWNDTLDIDYDRRVARCRLRPLARGAVQPWQAHILTAVTAILAFVCLIALQSEDCLLVAVPSMILLWLYPYAKRFTDFPQAILGIQVAFGVLMGIGALYDGLLSDLILSPTAPTDTPNVIVSITALYMANGCWTILYDTIYAQQDVEDDAKAGVRSMAVHFRGHAKRLLSVVAFLQVILLTVSGQYAGFGPLYHYLACGFTAVSLAYMIITVDLTKSEECAWWFRNGCWLVGLSIAGGLGIEAVESFESSIM